MSLLDSFLEGRGESADSVAELGTVPMDYVSAYLDTPSAAVESTADKVIRSKTEQLLDAFLSVDYRRPDFATVIGLVLANKSLAHKKDTRHKIKKYSSGEKTKKEEGFLKKVIKSLF